MLLNKIRRRLENSVNAGSMADIAFLLLIFFLVTTTIVVDKGIRVKLPVYDPDPAPQPPAKNILSVKVNLNNQLLVEGAPTRIDQLKVVTKSFIMNPLRKKDLPSKPTKAIISLQNDRATTYETYLAVYNELKAAYNELWDEQAFKQFGKTYEALPKAGKKLVRATIPLVISEAEPTDLAQ
ncbi:MAG: ExbD/TolR family protein [Saprospiraceae bacterium]